ncbi:alpha/beta hydrolase family protein [Pseudaminobacter sp. NGMCC 1.201702]|uniref:alpha/beta hydrolase family protein n=1 Tax=Pseudaminobacter sp. NGMCC 1.201702 TaxID=3391825 RepID=UPI0039EF348E
MQTKTLEIAVDGQRLAGTVAVPKTGVPGVLFLHGWAGNQERDLDRAQTIAAFGCVCLTFDLRGHALTEVKRQTVTREDNLRDAVAAYDVLVSQPMVDASCIAVVGSSYGGYLAAFLSSLRPVKWMALRVPALYRDADWSTPKAELDRLVLNRYRRSLVRPEDNRVLGHCQTFEGDVLIIESERDNIVPHPAIASYVAAFTSARSLTYRVIEGADHALSDERSRDAYNSLLAGWIKEMVLGAR